MRQWLKVWWHSLLNTFRLSEDHRMCEVSVALPIGKTLVYHYCACGFNYPWPDDKAWLTPSGKPVFVGRGKNP